MLINSLWFWQINIKTNYIALASAELFSVSKEIEEIHKIHNMGIF